MFLEHRRSPTALEKYVRWTTISVGRTLVTKQAWAWQGRAIVTRPSKSLLSLLLVKRNAVFTGG